MIWKDDRVKFTQQPEVYYTDKNVCISGRLETFRDQVQIVVHSEEQIIVQQDKP